MTSRTISLADDAYERLKARKRPHESFTDVVRRLTMGPSLLQLADVMKPESAARLADAIDENRRQRRLARARELRR
ncbi:MAG: antitoxin VapB family protein [Euryarchaeota archaeon]|nr:antitoxin VapB family protein [Euryarchaeota archaeon]